MNNAKKYAKFGIMSVCVCAICAILVPHVNACSATQAKVTPFPGSIPINYTAVTLNVGEYTLWSSNYTIYSGAVLSWYFSCNQSLEVMAMGAANFTNFQLNLSCAAYIFLNGNYSSAQASFVAPSSDVWDVVFQNRGPSPAALTYEVNWTGTPPTRPLY